MMENYANDGRFFLMIIVVNAYFIIHGQLKKKNIIIKFFDISGRAKHIDIDRM